MSKSKELFMSVVQSGRDPDYGYTDEDYFYLQAQRELGCPSTPPSIGSERAHALGT
mgnify:CR=1 FL=1